MVERDHSRTRTTRASTSSSPRVARLGGRAASRSSIGFQSSTAARTSRSTFERVLDRGEQLRVGLAHDLDVDERFGWLRRLTAMDGGSAAIAGCKSRPFS